MKVVQIGSNKGDDNLSHYLKGNYNELEFGLFVEANPLHIGNLKNCYSQYSNVIIENVAIKVPSYQENTLKLYYHENDGPMYHVASCEKSHIEMYYPSNGLRHFEVPCISLDSLFEKYQIKDLDWLLLDIEGIDAEILLTTDWSKYNIKRIEYEKIHLGKDKEYIEKIFNDLGYVKTQSLHVYDEAWVKDGFDLKIFLSDIFDDNLYETDKNDLGYLENFYDDFLYDLKDIPITFMEIGVYCSGKGKNPGPGSIKLWKNYLHKDSKIYASDILNFDHVEGTFSIVGDMYSDEQSSKFSDEYFDLIIDDGPHTFESFTLVLKKYFSKIKTGGILVIEDIIDSNYIIPLVELSQKIGYSNCEVIDMTGKQNKRELLNLWKNGLYILKITK